MSNLSLAENSPKEQKKSIFKSSTYNSQLHTSDVPEILGSASVEDPCSPLLNKSPEFDLDISNEITRGPERKTRFQHSKVDNMDFSTWTQTQNLGPDIVTVLQEQDLVSIETLKDLPQDEIDALELNQEQQTILHSAIQSLGANDDPALASWAAEHDIDDDSLQKLKGGGFGNLDKLKILTKDDMKTLKIKVGQRWKLTKGIEELNCNSMKDTEFMRFLKEKQVNEDTCRTLIKDGYDTKEKFLLMDKEDIERLSIQEAQKRRLTSVSSELREEEELDTKSYENDFMKQLKQKQVKDDAIKLLMEDGYDTKESFVLLKKEDIVDLSIQEAQKRLLTSVLNELKESEGKDQQPLNYDTEFMKFLKEKQVKENTLRTLIKDGYDTKESFLLMDKEDIERLSIQEAQKRLLTSVSFELREEEEHDTQSYENDFVKQLKQKQVKDDAIKLLIEDGYDTKESFVLLTKEDIAGLSIQEAQKRLLTSVLNELKESVGKDPQSSNYDELQDDGAKKGVSKRYDEAYNEFLMKVGLKKSEIDKLKTFGMDSPEALMIINADFNVINLSKEQTAVFDDVVEKLKQFYKDPDMKNTIATVVQSERRNTHPSKDVVIGAYIDFVAKTKGLTKPSSANIASYMDSVGTTAEPSGMVIENGMRIVKLPVKQIYEDRKGKIRKCIIGKEKPSEQQKTIMLVGATGAGKSSLVNGLCNYIFDTKWKETNRLKLIDEHKDELNNVAKGQSMSQTEWITIYTINSGDSNKVPYVLNLIDTPGFGDTRGMARDQELVEQIRSLFKDGEKHEIDEINAVCFVAKAPDARLTPSQRYIFSAIMSVFGKDIAKNILVMITFGDGAEAPVLEAIEKAQLPYVGQFKFNNSALFANNGIAQDPKTYRKNASQTPDVSTAFSEMFWDMGIQSFQAFFAFLEKLSPKSLYLTNEVLEQRRSLKDILANLEEKVRIGLSQLEHLKQEETILKENENKMADNKDFKYYVTIDFFIKSFCKPWECVTHCMTCQETCHPQCTIREDDKKSECDVMDKETGNCMSCKGRCSWKDHKNTGYSLQPKSKLEERTWKNKLQEYTKATDIVDKTKGIIEEILAKQSKCEQDVRNYVHKCRHILTSLKRIAMKPDSLTEVEYIEELIRAERDERKAGWKQRVEQLEKFKKEAKILNQVFTEPDMMTTD